MACPKVDSLSWDREMENFPKGQLAGRPIKGNSTFRSSGLRSDPPLAGPICLFGLLVPAMPISACCRKFCPFPAALKVQAAAMHWGWDLIRPQLEQQALNRAGLTVATDRDGGRWILFPEGTATWNPADGQRGRMQSPHYFLIPDRS